MDIVLSVLILFFLLPVYLVTAIAVKLDSKGPVIFKQKRLGKGGKVFYMYKFRSMCVGAEQRGSGVYSGQDDARVTRVGKFLRATSIDELPQFVNILKGDMSIVGPRPRLIKDMIFYDDEVIKLAYSVRPGLTGPAQVYDRNSELSWESVFARDIDYAQKVTFWKDLKLFFGTFIAVFKGGSASGAEENAEKREYYYADHLLKSNQITKEQYALGLTQAQQMEESKKATIKYNEELHNKKEDKDD